MFTRYFIRSPFMVKLILLQSGLSVIFSELHQTIFCVLCTFLNTKQIVARNFVCLSVYVCLRVSVCLSGFPTHSHSVNPHPNMFLIVVATTNLVKRIIRSFHSGFFRKIFTSLIFYIFRLKKGMLFISDLSSTGLSL